MASVVLHQVSEGARLSTATKAGAKSDAGDVVTGCVVSSWPAGDQHLLSWLEPGFLWLFRGSFACQRLHLLVQAACSQGVVGYTQTLRLSVHSECPGIEQEQPSCRPLSVS